jgi:uncharacterized damage-inducible protein DinB
MDAVATYASASSASLVRAAAALTSDSEVTFVMELDDRKRGPKSVLLIQALQHGIEHREQICATLTCLGIEPPVLSGWAYGDATGAMVELRD